MSALVRGVALGCLLLLLAACNPFNSQPKVDEIQIRRNQQPTQAYKIAVTIADAPGPFTVVSGGAAYVIANRACGKTDKWGGFTAVPNTGVSVELTKVSETRYEGMVYLDLLVNEDYYGKGVCRWEFNNTGVSFAASADKYATAFVPSLSASEVLAEKPVTTYFRKELYPQVTTLSHYSDLGQTDRSKFAAYITDAGLFTITMTATKVQP